MNAFVQGAMLMRTLLDDRDRQRTLQQLQDIQSANPQQIQGYTKEQGDELRAAAAQGKTISWDGKQYVISDQPASDSTNPAMPQVFQPTAQQQPGETGAISMPVKPQAQPSNGQVLPGQPSAAAPDRSQTTFAPSVATPNFADNQSKAIPLYPDNSPTDQSKPISLDQNSGNQQTAAAQSANPALPVSLSGKPVAMQQVTEFLGKRTPGSLDDGQVNRARMMAMAGVVSQTDPVAGQRMIQQQDQADREQKRFGWEEIKNTREQALAKRDDEYQTERQRIFNDGYYGQHQKEYADNLVKYKDDLAKYEAAGGAQSGMAAPVQPQRSQYTPMMSMADTAALVANDAKYGKIDTEKFQQITKTMENLKKEGYISALNKAQAGADIKTVADDFNKNGVMRFNPDDVVGDKMVPNKNGFPERIITLKDGQTINVMAELSAHDATKQHIDQYYKALDEKRSDNADKRGDKASSRAESSNNREQVEFNSKESNRKLNKLDADLRIELGNVDESTPEGKARSEQIQAKLLAIKTGARGIGAGHDPADIVKARNLVADGYYETQAQALDAVISKPDKMFQEFQNSALKNAYGNAEQANQSALKMMENNGWMRTEKGTWKRSGTGAGANPKFGPAKGTVVDGFEFQGGNPNDKNNWKPKK